MELKAEILAGGSVRLEPVTDAMHDAMRAALDIDPDAWANQYMCGRADHFPAYWAAMTTQPHRITFAVRLQSTGALVGTTSFLHISAANRTVEIGSTFLRPEARGTAVNPEMKLLMLAHAFEQGALRVQLTVDNRNARSQAAVAKLGAAREGVLRRHLITWTGHNRDTVMFSIIDTDWPEVRERLTARLAAEGATP